MSDATYYKWKSKYGGMDASDVKRLKEFEEVNREWANDQTVQALMTSQVMP